VFHWLKVLQSYFSLGWLYRQWTFGLVTWTLFQAIWRSCLPTNSIKALMWTQSSDRRQYKETEIYSSTVVNCWLTWTGQWRRNHQPSSQQTKHLVVASQTDQGAGGSPCTSDEPSSTPECSVTSTRTTHSVVTVTTLTPALPHHYPTIHSGYYIQY